MAVIQSGIGEEFWYPGRRRVQLTSEGQIIPNETYMYTNEVVIWSTDKKRIESRESQDLKILAQLFQG